MAIERPTKIIVCDASPLIFLAKLNRLDWVEQVTGARAVVLRCVVREILSDQATPLEAQRLRDWLTAVEVVDYDGDLVESQALSLSDRTNLAWAFQRKAEWFLVDERLLRRFAKERGIRVIGFCGLLLRAVDLGISGKAEAQSLIDTAIREHGFRISIELYQAIRRRLER